MLALYDYFTLVQMENRMNFEIKDRSILKQRLSWKLCDLNNSGEYQLFTIVSLAISKKAKMQKEIFIKHVEWPVFTSRVCIPYPLAPLLIKFLLKLDPLLQVSF